MKTLDQILTPTPREDFIRDVWGKRFLHVPGAVDKFSSLFSWDILNRALEEHRFDADRLVLYRQGQRLAADRYLHKNTVDARKLTSELANGATLILDQCEELYPPLRDLCVHLELLFQRRVVCNLYAGWRTEFGFEVHWDPQNTLILQVAGRKRWKIWEPTLPDPLGRWAETARPTTEPLFDILVEPGDLLSIPRGWWHIAIPIDEPCLHLTVTVPSLTGIDLLHWVADEMIKRSHTARKDVPLLEDIGTQAQWLEMLKSDLETLLSNDPLSRFLAHRSAMARPRPSLALPMQAEKRSSAASMEWIQLAVARPLFFIFEGTGASCRANGSVWKLDAETARRMLALNDGKPHPTSEICTGRSRLYVAGMVMGGVLKSVPAPDGDRFGNP